MTADAVALLGNLVAQGRREKQWTQDELAERLGVSKPTVARIERGDLGVAIGTVFEAAVFVGVDLFGDRQKIATHLVAQRDRLSLLPERVRTKPPVIDDDF